MSQQKRFFSPSLPLISHSAEGGKGEGTGEEYKGVGKEEGDRERGNREGKE